MGRIFVAYFWTPQRWVEFAHFPIIIFKVNNLLLSTAGLTCRLDKLLPPWFSRRNNGYRQRCFCRPLLRLQDQDQDASLSLKGNSWVPVAAELAQSLMVDLH
jgi:hypothetical protein